MLPLITPPETLFLCPRCGELLSALPPCSCGFSFRESNGILDLMTDHELANAEPFLNAYEEIRSDEKWGNDDLDLPFRPLRHRDIWNIRQRTFRRFRRLISKVERGIALDVGAGNCWMTRYPRSMGIPCRRRGYQLGHRGRPWGRTKIHR